MDAYESLGAIGEGTYGVVIRARHRATGQVVAIKRFKESEEDEQTRKTSLREVRVLKQLRHDNVVGLLDVFRRKGKLHIVFEYIEKTILEVLDATPRGIDPLNVKKYMYQLLRGLEFCHAQNIVHRDVKPENILISERGTLKICDFGFARPMTVGGKYTDYVATRWYRAPELLVGDVEYGKGVDIWAVGCIFSEISTGQPLFPGESDFDQLAHILRCCGKIPQRFVQIFYKNPLYKNVDLPPQRVTETLDDRFRHPPSACWLQFMKGCLKCDPADRDSCSGLLQSPYFEDTSDFSKAKYEAYIQTVYEEEQLLRAQLMAVSPPQQNPSPSTLRSGPNAFLPDLGGRPPSGTQTVKPHDPACETHFPNTTSTLTPAAASNSVKQSQGTLWSQYLASASHELPELGTKSGVSMPSINGNSNPSAVSLTPSSTTPYPQSEVKGNGSLEKPQPYVLKTTSTKLPTTLSSMPPLQTGTAYRLPIMEGANTVSTAIVANAPTPPSGVSTVVKVKDSTTRPSLSLSTSGPAPDGPSPTPPNSLSVVGQGGRSSPSPSTNGLTTQLTYKKKPQKKSVLASLNFTSYEGQQHGGNGLVVAPKQHVGGLNSGLDPFGGAMFLPTQSSSGFPRAPGTYPTTNANPYALPQDRRGSVNAGLPAQTPSTNHLYTTGGSEGNRLSDLILKGRTSQHLQHRK